MSSTICHRCNRNLKNPQSQERCYGPLCWSKVQPWPAGPGGRDMDSDEKEYDKAMQTLEMNESRDIVIRREKDGTVVTNVPWSVVVHSPDGFEFGYGGSGPADLALNILNFFIPPGRGDLTSHRGWQGKGRYSELAWALHQDFKWEFLGTLPEEGGIIPGDVIRAWITARAPQLELEAV